MGRRKWDAGSGSSLYPASHFPLPHCLIVTCVPSSSPDISEVATGKGDVTQLLKECQTGDDGSFERLMAVVYPELRSLARRQLGGERDEHTLQATALVHEAYLRLVGADIEWSDRKHFYAVAARAMRRVLVDHARSRASEKRGGEYRIVTLDPDNTPDGNAPIDLMALDDALSRLAQVDERKARALELHYFGGLTYDETARALDVSPATIHRELQMAKAWLASELS